MGLGLGLGLAALTLTLALAWVKTPGVSSESGTRHSSTQGPERARPVARNTFSPAARAFKMASAFAGETCERARERWTGRSLRRAKTSGARELPEDHDGSAYHSQRAAGILVARPCGQGRGRIRPRRARWPRGGAVGGGCAATARRRRPGRTPEAARRHSRAWRGVTLGDFLVI